VEAVYRREEVYWGDRLERAADVVFIPTRMEYFGFGEYEFGSNEIIERMKRGISGTHRLNGMALLWGQAVLAGARLQGAQIVDLAPTILHLMGEPVPQDMDGRVLTQVLTPEYAEVLLPERELLPSVPSPEGSTTADEALSGEEAELVLSRLRALGYVG
jgi:hypothetical protein